MKKKFNKSLKKELRIRKTIVSALKGGQSGWGTVQAVCNTYYCTNNGCNTDDCTYRAGCENYSNGASGCAGCFG
ncbi:hypothetical protein ACJD0Z_06935 [Flavobacteriaceae bacterium M23B6Z8]